MKYRIDWWEIKYKWENRKEKCALWVAFHVPKWLVYWCTIRAYGNAWRLAGNKTPDELSPKEVLEGIYAPKERKCDMLNARTVLDIEDELVRQHGKWGIQDHTDVVWFIILAEEVGEIAKGYLDDGDTRDAISKEKRDEAIEKEIIHTISVAVNWLQRKRVNRGVSARE